MAITFRSHDVSSVRAHPGSRRAKAHKLSDSHFPCSFGHRLAGATSGRRWVGPGSVWAGLYLANPVTSTIFSTYTFPLPLVGPRCTVHPPPRLAQRQRLRSSTQITSSNSDSDLQLARGRGRSRLGLGLRAEEEPVQDILSLRATLRPVSTTTITSVGGRVCLSVPSRQHGWGKRVGCQRVA